MSEQQIAWEPEPQPEPVAMSEEPINATPVTAEGEPLPKKPEPPIVPEPTVGGAPAWAILPEGLVVPRGRAAFFARFPSNWTDTPTSGVQCDLTVEERVAWKLQGVTPPAAWRQCIFWALSVGDQKLALGRANGDTNRFNSELTKQMIRSVDGVLVDRSGIGVVGNLDVWWEQLGERCRSELTRMCLRIHSLTMQERSLFLGYCIAARAAG